MDMVIEQLTEVCKSSISRYVQPLKDRIASLEKELQEKDKLIAHLQVRNVKPIMHVVIHFNSLHSRYYTQGHIYSCDVGMGDLPDVYAQNPRAVGIHTVSGKS